MNDEFTKRVVKRGFEYYESYQPLLEEKFSGLGWGTYSLTDREFERWFLMKAAENPNWLFALPYVRGGRREMGRYQRLITEEVKSYDGSRRPIRESG